MDVNEVQRALGVSRTKAYEVARQIGIRVGDRVLVSRERMREYINGDRAE